MNYDLIVVGTGFAGNFFLKRALEKLPESARVLVLERGKMTTHADQVRMRANSETDAASLIRQTGMSPEEKRWVFNVGFGGGSNCWWAGTPRMLPSDFRIRSQYGVGIDWPISYDELEPYYCDAEEAMSIAGPSENSPYRRSRPYPLPPHRLTEPERIVQKTYPQTFFPQPNARASRAVPSRARCCANGVCGLCPVDSKFTALNGFTSNYDDPRVELRLESEVVQVDREGSLARGVTYRSGGKLHSVSGDTIVLAANAIFNPHLMMRSGFEHPRLGRRLHEQLSFNAFLYLDGLDGFQGSTSVTGQGYMLYEGEHRREAGAVLMETWNVPRYRPEPGKWRQFMEVYVIVEDLPLDENFVEPDPENPDRARAHYQRHSDYGLNGVARAREKIPDVFSCLPIEKIEFTPIRDTDSHIQGTTMMGDDPATSVIDRDSVHHEVRNLLVLGSSTFPTGPAPNPTLTLSALAIRAAEQYYA